MKKTFSSKSLVVSGVFALLAYLLLSVPAKVQARTDDLKFVYGYFCYTQQKPKALPYGTCPVGTHPYFGSYKYSITVRNDGSVARTVGAQTKATQPNGVFGFLGPFWSFSVGAKSTLSRIWYLNNIYTCQPRTSLDVYDSALGYAKPWVNIPLQGTCPGYNIY